MPRTACPGSDPPGGNLGNDFPNNPASWRPSIHVHFSRFPSKTSETLSFGTLLLGYHVDSISVLLLSLLSAFQLPGSTGNLVALRLAIVCCCTVSGLRMSC